MTKGIRAYDRKERREVRMRNHIAHDLGSPKYRQRIKQPKKRAIIDSLREQELQRELEEETSRYDPQDRTEIDEASKGNSQQ